MVIDGCRSGGGYQVSFTGRYDEIMWLALGSPCSHNAFNLIDIMNAMFVKFSIKKRRRRNV